MSAEDFQLIDETVYDNSIIKRVFSKIYHEQGANLNDSDENIIGENNYYQIGNP